MVPAMIYVIGMPTKLVPGTSLFVTIFITAFVVIGHALQFQTIDFILVSILLTGSIIGVHLGLKASEKLNASEYKTLLAILLLGVGLIMGIEQFVLEKGTLFNASGGGQINNRLAEFVLYFSKNNPISYGFLSILTVVLAGISFSYARELGIILDMMLTKNIIFLKKLIFISPYCLFYIFKTFVYYYFN